MEQEKWLFEATNGAAPSTAARKAGLPPSTITRQLDRGQLSAEVVIKIARAYDAPVIEGLVRCGHLTEEEARLRYTLEAGVSLKDASDQELLWELLDRVDEDGMLEHPLFEQELDENHPALTVIHNEDFEGRQAETLAAKLDSQERPDSLYDQ